VFARTEILSGAYPDPAERLAAKQAHFRAHVNRII
jgi:hypothetical protein